MLDPGIELDAVVTQHSATGWVTDHGRRARFIATGFEVWVTGADFWRSERPDVAAQLGDRWVRLTPPSAIGGLQERLSDLPVVLAGTVFGPHPGLRVTGSATIGGRQATELRVGKDIYDVAADGSDLPLRWLDGDIPGPDGKPCGVTLSDFGHTETITPPPDSIDLPSAPGASPSP